MMHPLPRLGALTPPQAAYLAALAQGGLARAALDDTFT